MKVYVYYKGRALPDGTFNTLFGAKEHMESNKYTGIVVIVRNAVLPEVIWYKPGETKMKGVRTISGREFMLCGHYTSRGRADYVADSLLREWEQTRVRKTPHRFGDWSVWVSGRRNAERIPIETIREATVLC